MIAGSVLEHENLSESGWPCKLRVSAALRPHGWVRRLPQQQLRHSLDLRVGCTHLASDCLTTAAIRSDQRLSSRGYIVYSTILERHSRHCPYLLAQYQPRRRTASLCTTNSPRITSFIVGTASGATVSFPASCENSFLWYAARVLASPFTSYTEMGGR